MHSRSLSLRTAGEGRQWTPWGFALVKAAIAAKFMLIGRALHIGDGFRTKPFIWQTLHNSIAFLIFVAVLTVIEEVMVGFIHGRIFRQSMSEFGGGTAQQLIATLAIVFLVFLPFFALGALCEVMGAKALVRSYFVKRSDFEVANQPQ